MKITIMDAVTDYETAEELENELFDCNVKLHCMMFDKGHANYTIVGEREEIVKFLNIVTSGELNEDEVVDGAELYWC